MVFTFSFASFTQTGFLIRFSSQRNLFVEQRASNKLKFGTSVFHSYVHQWACQLRYNPRLNSDWGMSDGEGLERIWSELSSLVGALRYSTKAHRLCALNLRAQHSNEAKRRRSSKPFLIISDPTQKKTCSNSNMCLLCL